MTVLLERSFFCAKKTAVIAYCGKNSTQLISPLEGEDKKEVCG
jgi:hypothetical protein